MQAPSGFAGCPCPSPYDGVRSPSHPRSSDPALAALNQPALPARVFVGAAFRQSPPRVRLCPGPFRLGHPCERSNRPAEIPPGFLPAHIVMQAGRQQVSFRSFRFQPCGRNRLSGIRNLRLRSQSRTSGRQTVHDPARESFAARFGRPRGIPACHDAPAKPRRKRLRGTGRLN
jgi:hypothetical protein